MIYATLLLCYLYANTDSHLDHFYSLLIHILKRLKHSRHHFAVELVLTKIEGLILVYTYGWLSWCQLWTFHYCYPH